MILNESLFEKLVNNEQSYKEIASQVRKEIVDKYGEDFLYGKCIEASEKIVELLSKEGINSKTIEGWVHYDCDEGCTDRDYDEHTWVETEDGYIIDVTATQFNSFMEEDYPDIIISKELPHGYSYDEPDAYKDSDFDDQSYKNLFESKKRKNKMKTDYSLPQSKFKTVDDILKFHKKRQKGQGTFVTYDVGNMEYNNSLFNRAMGSGDIVTSVGTSADASAAASGGAVGMGESLQCLNESRKLTPTYHVKEYLENYVDVLEQDPVKFISNAIRERNSYNLYEVDLSNLLRILHKIDIDVTQKVAVDCGYTHYFINYDSDGNDFDYLTIIQDVVDHIPNRYIDKKYFEDYTADEVMQAIISELAWESIETSMPEDDDSKVEGIRVECYIAGMSGAETYRNIGIQIIVTTASDAGVIEVSSFDSLLLHSLGYFVNLPDANSKMDYYENKIKNALKNIIKE